VVIALFVRLIEAWINDVNDSSVMSHLFDNHRMDYRVALFRALRVNVRDAN